MHSDRCGHVCTYLALHTWPEPHALPWLYHLVSVEGKHEAAELESHLQQKVGSQTVTAFCQCECGDRPYVVRRRHALRAGVRAPLRGDPRADVGVAHEDAAAAAHSHRLLCT